MRGTDAVEQEGWYVSSDEDAAMYRLVRRVHTGGEGELWQAERVLGRLGGTWAIKILLPRHVDQDNDETPNQALDRWRRMWQDTIDRTIELRDIPGVVPTARAFTGPAPHPDPQPPESAVRSLFLVTPWVDGRNLGTWQQEERPAPGAVADVVARFARQLDALADHGQVHRDISPGNVMVKSDGQVLLIDFAFMRATGSATTRRYVTAGYAAPEHEITPACDRYSFGAIVYHLLTGVHPPMAHAREQAARDLAGFGYPARLAEHVGSLLAYDPRQRPARLTDWAEEFRALFAEGVPAGAYRDVAIAATGAGASRLAAAGIDRIGAVTVSPVRHPALLGDDAGPGNPLSVAAARHGSGEVILMATAADGGVWHRSGARWHHVEDLQVSGPVRVAAGGDGSVAGFAIDRQGVLATVTVSLDGRAEVARSGVARRVLAAATGVDGRPQVVVEASDGGVLCGPPARLDAVGLAGADAAALTPNTWGELVCAAIRTAQRRVAIAETLLGDWEEPLWLDAPDEPLDVACAGHRQGVSVAIATAGGLWLRDTWTEADWRPLWNGRVTRVVMTHGGWRTVLAAVADQQIVMCEENAGGGWPATATLVKG
ncbi:protein kinase [Actinoplanes hulinensis]|uniref:non-specific serine/threonine protein kinase n=1 Tax=Actinoplanes hulinensis TaxID=1144547 RepID=A0ABS7B698_9ACTN|nr:protein kinase [Actinoplanes hulinensis]MBW6436458.1 protein kinase [Actinoplanes hulinensis]